MRSRGARCYGYDRGHLQYGTHACRRQHNLLCFCGDSPCDFMGLKLHVPMNARGCHGTANVKVDEGFATVY